MACNQCGGRFTVSASVFPGFDLLHCADCGRPIRLIQKNTPRVSEKPVTKAALNRALRAGRRSKMMQELKGEQAHGAR